MTWWRTPYPCKPPQRPCSCTGGGTSVTHAHCMFVSRLCRQGWAASYKGAVCGGFFWGHFMHFPPSHHCVLVEGGMHGAGSGVCTHLTHLKRRPCFRVCALPGPASAGIIIRRLRSKHSYTEPSDISLCSQPSPKLQNAWWCSAPTLA